MDIVDGNDFEAQLKLLQREVMVKKRESNLNEYLNTLNSWRKELVVTKNLTTSTTSTTRDAYKTEQTQHNKPSIPGCLLTSSPIICSAISVASWNRTPSLGFKQRQEKQKIIQSMKKLDTSFDKIYYCRSHDFFHICDNKSILHIPLAKTLTSKNISPPHKPLNFCCCHVSTAVNTNGDSEVCLISSKASSYQQYEIPGGGSGSSDQSSSNGSNKHDKDAEDESDTYMGDNLTTESEYFGSECSIPNSSSNPSTKTTKRKKRNESIAKKKKVGKAISVATAGKGNILNSGEDTTTKSLLEISNDNDKNIISAKQILCGIGKQNIFFLIQKWSNKLELKKDLQIRFQPNIHQSCKRNLDFNHKKITCIWTIKSLFYSPQRRRYYKHIMNKKQFQADKFLKTTLINEISIEKCLPNGLDLFTIYLNSRKPERGRGLPSKYDQKLVEYLYETIAVQWLYVCLSPYVLISDIVPDFTSIILAVLYYMRKGGRKWGSKKIIHFNSFVADNLPPPSDLEVYGFKKRQLTDGNNLLRKAYDSFGAYKINIFNTKQKDEQQ
jgi:hypothetical protein